MKIKGVSAKAIFDSKKEKTIEVSIKTNVGNFKASSLSGKSKGKHETKPYKKNISGDIVALKKLSEYFNQESIESFADLRRIEDIVAGHIGANSVVALEYAVLIALASVQKNQI
jgi:enolase